LAINAALTAQQRQLAQGARAKRIKNKVNKKLHSQTKLEIVAVEQQIKSDQCHLLPRQEEHTRYLASNQLLLDGFFTKKQPHPEAIMNSMKPNKRLRMPD
jgi:hypothetical protein